jgi:poly(hydroxyalkanoate) depolymerase family esterase
MRGDTASSPDPSEFSMKTKASLRFNPVRLAMITIAAALAIAIYGCRGSSASRKHRFALVEVNDFGSNPGKLQMFEYVPSSHPAKPPLVVAMHGCTQNAHDFANHSGWPELANRLGFLLVFPQQRLLNNPAKCFNWFLPADSTRNSGEALSIKQMVDKMKAAHGVDASRVYVTGLSGGGAMTNVMLAAYPDVFAGGAIMSGVPYGCAHGLSETFACMESDVAKTPQQWGDLVRDADRGAASWPIVSIWHGSADRIIAPVNAREEMMQWTNVHGLPAPSTSDTVNGFPHQVFKTSDGKAVVEVYSITDMGHGQAVAPGNGPKNCGSAEAFFPNEGICSAYYALKFWGIAR